MRFVLESVIEHWHGDRAELRSLLDGSTQSVDASAIVTATTNSVDNAVELALSEQRNHFHLSATRPHRAPRPLHFTTAARSACPYRET